MTGPVQVRAVTKADTAQALALYNELTIGPKTQDETAFGAVLHHPGTQVFGVFASDVLLAMVTLHVLPNVTWGARPYALIENVVTAQAHQGQGHGRRAMQAAINAAWAADSYKIMLMTGRRRGAKGFYEALGFSDEDKFAMVMRKPEQLGQGVR